MGSWAVGNGEKYEEMEQEADEAWAAEEKAIREAPWRKMIREVVTDVLRHELQHNRIHRVPVRLDSNRTDLRRSDSHSPGSTGPGAVSDNETRPDANSTKVTTPDAVRPDTITEAIPPDTISSTRSHSSLTSRTSTISIDARDYIRDELRCVIKEELRRNRKSYRLKIWIVACTDLILDFGHRDENGHYLGFWGRRRHGIADGGGSMVVCAGALAAGAPVGGRK
ncbi:hypothetical protein BDZ85DRAFT_267463 [Elsinoe ampelina]|uniref:Uncharacterized protein n=1 Tax=Elsinoe ampelina TaxID=302913 RepID=A0A6A6G3T4_9PEZI|nr:hypothetical protein BDZ85DRAFT_267463 [Elsinoe ampelina]